MQLDEIKKIIDLLEASKLKKLRIKNKEFEIELEKEDLHPKPKPIYHEHSEAPQKGKAKSKEFEDSDYIKSPMVGTFYSSPAPDKPVFLKVGDSVDKESIVCIIEAVKVMNEVKASCKGKIVEILVDNASPVEFGTKLFRIES